MRDDDLSGQLGDLIRHGRIASVDLAGGRITVSLGDLETGPIRWFTGGAGGTRVWSRPKVGEQVTLLTPGGDIVGAIALRGVVCNAYPPLGDEERELVEFEDGAILAYDPKAHRLEVVLPGGATASIVAPGGVTIDADVRITGDLVVDRKVTAETDVVGAGISLKSHRHGLVAAGTAKSGTPE